MSSSSILRPGWMLQSDKKNIFVLPTTHNLIPGYDAVDEAGEWIPFER